MATGGGGGAGDDAASTGLRPPTRNVVAPSRPMIRVEVRAAQEPPLLPASSATPPSAGQPARPSRPARPASARRWTPAETCNGSGGRPARGVGSTASGYNFDVATGQPMVGVAAEAPLGLGQLDAAGDGAATAGRQKRPNSARSRDTRSGQRQDYQRQDYRTTHACALTQRQQPTMVAGGRLGLPRPELAVDHAAGRGGPAGPAGSEERAALWGQSEPASAGMAHEAGYAVRMFYPTSGGRAAGGCRGKPMTRGRRAEGAGDAWPPRPRRGNGT